MSCSCSVNVLSTDLRCLGATFCPNCAFVGAPALAMRTLPEAKSLVKALRTTPSLTDTVELDEPCPVCTRLQQSTGRLRYRPCTAFVSLERNDAPGAPLYISCRGLHTRHGIPPMKRQTAREQVSTEANSGATTAAKEVCASFGGFLGLSNFCFMFAEEYSLV